MRTASSRLTGVPLDLQLFQEGLQSAAVDELHHHVVQAGFGVKVIDLHNVGVAQRSDNFGFALKAAEEIGIVGEEGVNHFDRHMAIEAGLIGLVDIGHAPMPHLLDDAIASDSLSGQPLHFSGLRFLARMLARFLSRASATFHRRRSCPAILPRRSRRK